MSVDRETENKRVLRLADELFRLVEKAQGFAFISDGEGAGMTEQQFFVRIRGRLQWTEKSARIIRAFLIQNEPSHAKKTVSRRRRGEAKGGV